MELFRFLNFYQWSVSVGRLNEAKYVKIRSVFVVVSTGSGQLCCVWIWMKTEEEQTCQRPPFPDGINVAEESAGKRFKVEWDFQEERRKIKKFVNLGQRNLHLKRIETGN